LSDRAAFNDGQPAMTYRGGGTLDWQSDYSQFYVEDFGTSQFAAPIDITPDMMTRRWCRVPGGLVVYTNDCLQKLIELRIDGRISSFGRKQFKGPDANIPILNSLDAAKTLAAFNAYQRTETAYLKPANTFSIAPDLPRFVLQQSSWGRQPWIS
jgi:hypothetical protein